jgi:glutamine synthetase
MTTPARLPFLSERDAAARVDALRREGVRLLTGTFVDCSGVFRAKQTSIDRAAVFGAPGLGASPVWVIFCIDDGIAFTPRFGAVGDMRMRADLDAVVQLGDGVAWAPLELADQEGEPMAFDPRGAVRREQSAIEADGIDVLAATEIEFCAFAADDHRVAGHGGPAYGLAPLLEQSAFVDDVHAAFEHAGIGVEQLHAEYGPGQFEMSLAPQAPMRAADHNVVARILLCRAARRNGLRLSFSPRAFPEGVGNGAHVHLSFWRGGTPLLSGGDGPYGLTDDGGAIVAGYVQALPEVIGTFAPSLLSGLRLQPSHWSGAYACWGLENREAAVRLIAGTPGNPRGASIEVKCIDPSANPYVVYAMLTGIARRSLAERPALPPETTTDPATLTQRERDAAGIVQMENHQPAMLDLLEKSPVATDILGDELLEALLAVRRHEAEVAEKMSVEELVERFRFAWSV